MSKVKTVEASLMCPCCFNVTTIQRRQGRTKQPGHIKHMWCFRCKDITGHIEQRAKW